MDETMYPAAAGPAEDQRPRVTLGRRKELLRLAEQVAEDLAGQVAPHERCFFRQAVEMLLER